MQSRPHPRQDGDDGQRRLAVLIDADNAQPSVIAGLLAEVAKYGVASVKRIYGDFTSTRATQWKARLLEHSINPVQQFAYTSGKNATDSSLIIDAMDLMYTGRFDGVCLVSSDSDFTRLAQRLREEGLMVYGFGERKTPDAFVQACDKFIYTEVLRAAEAAAPSAQASRAAGGAAKRGSAASAAARTTAAAATPAPASAGASSPRAAGGRGKARATANADDSAAVHGAAPDSAAPAAGSTAAPERVGSGRPAALPLPLDLLRRAIEDASDEHGWAHLGATGSYLTKLRPDFDPRLYGHRKLSDMVRAYPEHFLVEERGAAGGGKAVYVMARDTA